MKPWAWRTILVLFAVGVVVSIAMGSALPVVLAICLCGLLAAAEIHSR
jgi:hypothetical protein